MDRPARVLFSSFPLTGGAQMSSGVWGLFLPLFPEQKWEEDSAQLPSPGGTSGFHGQQGGGREGGRKGPALASICPW